MSGVGHGLPSGGARRVSVVGFSIGHRRTALALVEHARGRRRASVQAVARVLLRCGLRRIQLAVTLLDPSGAEMALHHDTDMVRAIFGARQVKFLFGPAGSQGQDTLA
jgi:hypothetical protein